MIDTVNVALQSRSYEVVVGPGSLADLGTRVASIAASGPIVLVSSDRVFGLHGATVMAAFQRASLTPKRVLIADDEAHKRLSTVERLYDAVLQGGADRRTLLVAFGGGVLGDMTGFAAATLLRGVPWVAVPTTLLSQVDAAIGGKTAVDRPQGKNLVGAFHQPALVLCDTSTLGTLSERDYRAGLAEVIKYGVALDGEFFAWLEEHAEELLAQDPAALQVAVTRSAAHKARIVEQDEREGGLRRVLNFGHTIGHAVEKLGGFERFVHGEAVAIGMVAAIRLSVDRGLCEAALLPRLVALLRRCGLPTAIPADMPAEALLAELRHDKKALGDRVGFVLIEALGRHCVESLSGAEIAPALDFDNGEIAPARDFEAGV